MSYRMIASIILLALAVAALSFAVIRLDNRVDDLEQHCHPQPTIVAEPWECTL